MTAKASISVTLCVTVGVEKDFRGVRNRVFCLMFDRYVVCVGAMLAVVDDLLWTGPHVRTALSEVESDCLTVTAKTIAALFMPTFGFTFILRGSFPT